MTAAVEQRIQAIARQRGISFNEAAAVAARHGARRKRAKQREAERLTAVRKTWSWARDFLD